MASLLGSMLLILESVSGAELLEDDVNFWTNKQVLIVGGSVNVSYDAVLFGGDPTKTVGSPALSALVANMEQLSGDVIHPGLSLATPDPSSKSRMLVFFQFISKDFRNVAPAMRMGVYFDYKAFDGQTYRLAVSMAPANSSNVLLQPSISMYLSGSYADAPRAFHDRDVLKLMLTSEFEQYPYAFAPGVDWVRDVTVSVYSTTFWVCQVQLASSVAARVLQQKLLSGVKLQLGSLFVDVSPAPDLKGVPCSIIDTPTQPGLQPHGLPSTLKPTTKPNHSCRAASTTTE